MPRKARLDAPGALHHIMVRGINRLALIRYIHLNQIRAGMVKNLKPGDGHGFKKAEEKQVRQLKLRRSGQTIERIIQNECAASGVSDRELKNGSRRHAVSVTRMRIAWRGVEELGLTSAEIARHLGVCTSTITRAIEKRQGRQEYAL